MRPPLSPTSNNVKRASEKGASQTSKKQRLGDTPLPSGAADQKPPADGNDVDTTTRDEAPPMEVEEEDTKPVAEEVPEEATEEDKLLDEGWLSPKGVVDDAVAAAKAAANAQSDGILTKLNAALEKCGTEGEPGSLELIPKKELKKATIDEIINIKEVDGASYASLFAKGARTSIVKAQSLVRPKLKELLKEATENKSVALEKAEVEARLGLELAAVKALSDDEPDVTTLRSLLACGSLLDNASSDCLTTSKDKTSGNVDRIVNAMREAGVELVGSIDGDALENTNENRVLCVISSLEAKIAAEPPETVARAVIARIGKVKHAPRTDDAARAALEADLRSRTSSFVARGAAFAAKVTPDLPPFPTRDARTLELLQAENRAWSAAPPAKQAAVWSGLAFDSHVLGTSAPLQKWPKLRGRPTIVGGVELGTIKEMGALAKMLVHGEKSEKGKPGKEKSG